MPQMRWVERPPEETDPARSDGGLGARHDSMILTVWRSWRLRGRHDQLSQQPVTHLLTCTYGRNMEYATNVW